MRIVDTMKRGLRDSESLVRYKTFLGDSVKINDVVKGTKVVCDTDGKWAVLGDAGNGKSVDFGKFKTSAEATCVSDFINSAISKGISVDSIKQLNDALDAHVGGKI